MRTHRSTLLALAFLLLIVALPQPGVARPQQAAVLEAAVDPAQLLPNGQQPLPDLLTGGQPSLAQLEEARRLGYETVINLRTDAEMEDGSAGRTAVENLGMTYISLPVAGGDDLNRAMAEALDAALAEATGPTIVHCMSGNRVGALLALRAYYLEGATADEALELGRSAGLTRLEPLVRQRLEENRSDE